MPPPFHAILLMGNRFRGHNPFNERKKAVGKQERNRILLIVVSHKRAVHARKNNSFKTTPLAHSYNMKIEHNPPHDLERFEPLHASKAVGDAFSHAAIANFDSTKYQSDRIPILLGGIPAARTRTLRAVQAACTQNTPMYATSTSSPTKQKAQT